jgi:hypothetical protein
MRHGDAAVRHHDYQIPQAQLEARVPGDTQDDDLPVEVPSFETDLRSVRTVASLHHRLPLWRLHQSL